MKKLFIFLVSLLFISCTSTKIIDQNNIIDTKEEVIRSEEEVEDLEKNNEKEKEITDKIDNLGNENLDLLEEIQLSFIVADINGFVDGIIAGKGIITKQIIEKKLNEISVGMELSEDFKKSLINTAIEKLKAEGIEVIE